MQGPVSDKGTGPSLFWPALRIVAQASPPVEWASRPLCVQSVAALDCAGPTGGDACATIPAG